jgi:hypothetical protein
MRLRVHHDGFKPVDSLEWRSAIASVIKRLNVNLLVQLIEDLSSLILCFSIVTTTYL